MARLERAEQSLAKWASTAGRLSRREVKQPAEAAVAGKNPDAKTMTNGPIVFNAFIEVLVPVGREQI